MRLFNKFRHVIFCLIIVGFMPHRTEAAAHQMVDDILQSISNVYTNFVEYIENEHTKISKETSVDLSTQQSIEKRPTFNFFKYFGVSNRSITYYPNSDALPEGINYEKPTLKEEPFPISGLYYGSFLAARKLDQLFPINDILQMEQDIRNGVKSLDDLAVICEEIPKTPIACYPTLPEKNSDITVIPNKTAKSILLSVLQKTSAEMNKINTIFTKIVASS